MARQDMKYGALALIGMWLVVGAAGCVTQTRIAAEHVDKLKSLTDVEAVLLKDTSLQMRTTTGEVAGMAMALVLGVGVIPNAAADVQKNHRLADPMLIVMPAVLEKLEKQGLYRISVVPEGQKATKPYQLQFRTTYWGMKTQNSEKSPLGYWFNGQIALVNTAVLPNEDLWRVKCDTDADAMAPRVTLAELTANGAALLKERIAQEAQRCVERLFADAPVAKN